MLLVAQQESYRGRLAAAAVRTFREVNIPAYQALLGQITPPALQLMLPELRLAKSNREEDRKPCTKVFQTIMGLPCSHIMRDRFQANGVLIPDDLHCFWRLRASRSPPQGHPRPRQPLLNPATPRAHREAESLRAVSRRPGNGLGSTRRDTCSFERAERAFEQRARQQSRARTSRRVGKYHPTRLSRMTSESSATPAVLEGAQDESSQPSQPLQGSQRSAVSRA